MIETKSENKTTNVPSIDQESSDGTARVESLACERRRVLFSLTNPPLITLLLSKEMNNHINVLLFKIHCNLIKLL